MSPFACMYLPSCLCIYVWLSTYITFKCTCTHLQQSRVKTTVDTL